MHMVRRIARRRDDERGYLLAITGLLLTVFTIFAALSVDIGSWYSRASQLQRTADAAALAGVVWMPDFTKASQIAIDAAAKNGFTTGGNIVVSASQVPGNNHQLKVTITDTAAQQYFSKIVQKSQQIGRSAIAAYDLGIPMGSPKNIIGSGNLLGSPDTENNWLAVSGYCSGRENGDLRLPHDDETYIGGTFTCPGYSRNDDYQSTGYFYAIDVPSAAVGQALNIQVYDAGYHPSGSPSDNQLRSGSSITTTYTIWDIDPTPLDGQPDTLATCTGGGANSTTFPSNDFASANSWLSLCKISVPQAGRYFVEVQTGASGADATNSFGSNGFSLRTFMGNGSWALCSTIGSSPSAACPQVHGVSEISVYANQSGVSTANFYLAQIDPAYANKIMQVTLFDPGEGAQTIKLLDPTGASQAFTWFSDCTKQDNPYGAAAKVTINAPSGGCSGSATASGGLDVSGTGTVAWSSPSGTPRVSSTSKYSDRFITLQLPVPATTWASSTGNWWKIQYITGSGTVTDRTTWSVSILGAPVHLIS
jgi:Flp pilus assembly protein TadG